MALGEDREQFGSQRFRKEPRPPTTQEHSVEQHQRRSHSDSWLPSRIRIPKNSEERVSRPFSLVNSRFLALAGRPAETICTKGLRVVFAMPKSIRRFTFHGCRWVVCCDDSGTRKSRTCQFELKKCSALGRAAESGARLGPHLRADPKPSRAIEKCLFFQGARSRIIEYSSS